MKQQHALHLPLVPQLINSIAADRSQVVLTFLADYLKRLERLAQQLGVSILDTGLIIDVASELVEVDTGGPPA